MNYKSEVVMENKKTKLGKKAVVNIEECVACGSCANECPLAAITIHKGIYANINENICVGCGKCGKICPASVIRLEERV